MAEENQQRFLEGFEGYSILRPSYAYDQSCESYPFRISELVFGSLLASYILGFIAVSSLLNTFDEGFLDTSSDVVSYLAISCSFSFLTAALYSVYHHSILTMPNVPISDLTTDFFIAMSQAILFGFSIIWPNSFFICLALLLFMVFLRQEVKFRALAVFFYTRLEVQVVPEIPPQPEARDASAKKPKKPKKTHDLFREKLSGLKVLEGWGPVKSSQYFYAGLLLVFGVLIVLLYWFKTNGFVTDYRLIKCLSTHFKLVRAIIFAGGGLILILRTRHILQEKSTAVDDSGQRIIQKMDAPAARLARSIKSPSNSQ